MRLFNKVRDCLVVCFEQQFLVFKQYYTISTHFFTQTYFQKIQIMLVEQYYQTGPNFQKSLFDKNNPKNEVFSQKEPQKAM